MPGSCHFSRQATVKLISSAKVLNSLTTDFRTTVSHRHGFDKGNMIIIGTLWVDIITGEGIGKSEDLTRVAVIGLQNCRSALRFDPHAGETKAQARTFLLDGLGIIVEQQK